MVRRYWKKKSEKLSKYFSTFIIFIFGCKFNIFLEHYGWDSLIIIFLITHFPLSNQKPRCRILFEISSSCLIFSHSRVPLSFWIEEIPSIGLSSILQIRGDDEGEPNDCLLSAFVIIVFGKLIHNEILSLRQNIVYLRKENHYFIALLRNAMPFFTECEFYYSLSGITSTKNTSSYYPRPSETVLRRALFVSMEIKLWLNTFSFADKKIFAFEKL